MMVFVNMMCGLDQRLDTYLNILTNKHAEKKITVPTAMMLIVIKSKRETQYYLWDTAKLRSIYILVYIQISEKY